jgi:hypothetical protein
MKEVVYFDLKTYCFDKETDSVSKTSGGRFPETYCTNWPS